MPFYTNLEISFTMGNVRFHAGNFSFSSFDQSMPSHSHGPGSYEIHYVPSGNGTLKLKDRDCQIVPNTLYITGPHVEHAQLPGKTNPMCEYCIYLRTESLPRSSKGSKDTVEVLSCFLDTVFWFGEDRQNIHQLFQDIFTELHTQGTGFMLETEALLRQLVIRLVRNYKDKKESGSLPDTRTSVFNPSLILEESFLYEYSTLTLDSLASRLGLSTRQTERLLQKQYGQTFLQKRTHAKMAAAASLLPDLSLTITDISELLGYSSVEHFSTAFRRHYGISAREYRKRLDSTRT
ncbi:AraC family transcriptional regulator [Murimonas intestini]|uniref:AraC family transcriptional regulator n=1 Tax=Murimonas intestini TaxID=1337051 RepID=UPI0011DD5ADF|nr:AraC family transcriptional regulator [Murimonas intestini]